VPVADDIIGSVAVEVLPNAKRFVQDFKAKVLPGARQAGDEIGNVAGAAAAKRLGDRLKAGIDEGFRRSDPARQGGKQGDQFAGEFSRVLKTRLEAAFKSLPKVNIDGNARGAERAISLLRADLESLSKQRVGIDISEKAALAKIEVLKIELDRLGRNSKSIQVRLDTKAAAAELVALETALSGVADAAAQGGSGAAGAGGGLGRGALLGGGIAAGLLLVGPAAGAATAGIAAVAGAAGATILAIKGIQTEVKNQNTAGRAFSAELKASAGSLHLLESTAARFAQGGLFSALSQVNAELPTLNPLVASLAKHLGTAFSIGTGGLIKGLEVAKPLLSDAGLYAERLAQKFADFTASPDFQRFINYARAELPIVAADLGDIAKMTTDVVVAVQPLGDQFLSQIDDVARGVDKLTGPLTALTHLTSGDGGSGKLFGFIDKATNPVSRITDLLGKLGGGGKNAAAGTAVLTTGLDDNARAAAFNQLALQNTGTAALTTSAAYNTATDAVKKQADQLAATTEQMRLQGDVMGLLKQAEDKLSGKAYDAANAQNTFEQGIISLLSNVKSGGPVFAGLSQAAITNRSSLLQLRDAALAAAGTYGDVSVSGSAAQKKLIELRQTIIDSTHTTGKAHDQVVAFVDSILKIPSSADVTVTAHTAAAKQGIVELGKLIAGVAGHHYNVYFDAKTNGTIPRGGNQVSLKATGGPITGPGTETSDSILIRASKNEFMVRASQAKKHRGLLELINTPGFAGGGLIDLSGSGPFSLGGGTGTKAAAAAKKSAASKAAAKAAATLATAQGNIRFTASLDLSRLQSSATASAIASVIRKLITDVHTAAAKGVGSNSLIPTLQAENSQLGRLANQRVALANKIKAATASLNAQRQASAQEAGQVAGSIGGTFNVTSLDSPAQFGTASPAGLIRNLQVEAKQVQNAATQLAQLRKLGLDKTLIQQLGEAGPGGFASIQSLSTATPAQIAQINALKATVNAASQAAGSQVAGSLYQTGIDSAAGYIRGLDSQLAKVNAAASRLAQTVIRQIKRDLGIHSPSLVMRQHGRYTGEGFAQGIADRYGMVTRSATGLANAAVQPAQFSRGQQLPAGLIQVNPAAGHNETAIGIAAGRYAASQFA
jgi:hypothetical protein